MTLPSNALGSFVGTSTSKAKSKCYLTARDVRQLVEPNLSLARLGERYWLDGDGGKELFPHSSNSCLWALRNTSTRAFMCRDRKVFLLLYKQFVRCHLEFAIPAWSPWLVQDIEILEWVQKRAVNFIVGLSGRTYEDKLRELKITSLAERRKKFDMVQTFKILNGHDRVDSSIWFKTVGDNANRLTRNTAYRNNLVATRSRTDIRKNFFSNRVVNLWNSLPTDVKDARTVKLFKARLEKINL